ncbi:MAG: thrombospondin type 3 repeat-containing protein [Candidatus Bathyarchaeia archaeon]
MAALGLGAAHYYLNIFSPQHTDSDGDGITDWDETHVYKTNPLAVDSDNDGLQDGLEIKLGMDPLVPNPAAAYALQKGLPQVYVEKFKDVPMDDNIKGFINYISEMPPYNLGMRDTIVEKALSDGKISVYEAKMLPKLADLGSDVFAQFLELGLDETTNKYLDVVSSLPEDFGSYVLKNKLCIQDRSLTDLEINFLKDPKKYCAQLFDVYMGEIDSAYPQLGKELRKLPDFYVGGKFIETVKNVEVLEDMLILAKTQNTKAIFQKCSK